MFLRRFTCAAREAVRTGSHTLAVHTAPLFPQATPEQYPYCAPWALPWNFRRRNLLRELVNYRADVMCLQEVQADHFENFLEPELAKFNYGKMFANIKFVRFKTTYFTQHSSFFEIKPT